MTAALPDVVARVRARLAAEGTLPIAPAPLDAVTARAYRIADEWERYTIAVANHAKAEDAQRAFRQRWPALVRWRDRTLANWRRERAVDVAAAYELAALECFLGGVPDLGERAQSEAVRVLLAPMPPAERGRRRA